jgi:hypothetical protein
MQSFEKAKEKEFMQKVSAFSTVNQRGKECSQNRRVLGRVGNKVGISFRHIVPKPQPEGLGLMHCRR